MKYFMKYFLNISKISRFFFGFTLSRLTFLCVKHYLSYTYAYCSSLSLYAVSKPVKDKYLLLCMISIMYLLLT